MTDGTLNWNVLRIQQIIRKLSHMVFLGSLTGVHDLCFPSQVTYGFYYHNRWKAKSGYEISQGDSFAGAFINLSTHLWSSLRTTNKFIGFV